MPRVLDEIFDSFYQKLAESDAVDDATVTELRELFQSGRKLKANDIVAILSKAGRAPPQ